MFQNSFQSGSFLEVFDAKVNKEKDKFYEKLYKIINPSGVNKVYDKQIKISSDYFFEGYIYEMEGGIKTKLQFPKEDKQELALIQHFLVLQIFIPIGAPFSIEIAITDTAKNKRRLNFTTAVNKIDKNYFHAKIPIDIIKRGIWLNLSLDLLSFFELFKGQTFRSIDSIIVGATCKLKKIFTMKNPIAEFNDDENTGVPSPNQNNTQFIPKTQNYLPGVIYINQSLTYDAIIKNYGEEISEIPEHININDDITTSSSTGIGLNNSLKTKCISMGTKDSRINPHRIATKQETRSEIKSRIEPIHVPLTADATLKSNKENLDNTPKIVIWNKNAHKINSATTELKNSSPTKLREEKSIGHQSRLRSESEIEEESKDNIQDTYRDGKAISQDASKKSKLQSTIKSQIKSPSILEKNHTSKEQEKSQYNATNKASKPDKNNGIANPWLDFAENQASIKKKTSKSNLLSNLPNTLQSPMGKDTKIKINEFQLGTNEKSQEKYNQSKISTENKDATKSFGKSGPVINGRKNITKNPSTSTKQTNKNSVPEMEEESKVDPYNKYSIMGNTVGSKTPDTTNSKFMQSHNIKKNASSASDKHEKTSRNNSTTFPNGNLPSGNEDIESIEENLEYEVNNSITLSDKLHHTPKLEGKSSNKKSIITKRSISEINNLTQEKNNSPFKIYDYQNQYDRLEEQTNEENNNLVDSLDNIPGKSYDEKTSKSKNGISKSDRALAGKLNEKEVENRKKSTYEEQMNNILNNVRPFSPPFSSTLVGNGEKSVMITKKNDDIVIINNDRYDQNDTINNNDKEDNLLEVIYDPVLNCYYNPKTNSYYELKNIN